MLIQGGIHKDERGVIMHVNDFDVSLTKRMYHFHQSDTSIIRAWQGHKYEQKWFHCVKGSYEVKSVILDNMDSPSKELKPKSYILSDDNSQVLHLPSGHANGFKALVPDSILMVFSDMDVEESGADLVRYDLDYWESKWEGTEKSSHAAPSP